MHYLNSTTFLSAALVLSLLNCLLLVSASSHSPADASLKRRHHARSPRPVNTDQTTQNLTEREQGGHTLVKRFDNARFSFFDTGLGACGKTNSRNDFIVAVNVPQYDNGAHCFEMITINYGGKTAQAQIVDKCMECPFGALDFSRGLFDFFGSEDAGYLYGSWNFNSGAAAPVTTTTTKQVPKPTTTTPTSTWTPPTSTSQKMSTSTSHSSSVVSSTSVVPSTTKPITPAVIATTPTPSPIQALERFNQAIFQLAELALSGAQAGGK